ncbi:hypothetical protein J2W36_001431 [Variovorax ginsengisoli]|uniref:Potassium-transporting ATPase subunit F n=1 Tax=Variovorax ginsengisoli TaxID=363844 RepID=A0ABT9S4B5_9BURK|nr:hypothetical protein [Variovorax ginsengisoli]
MLTILLCAVVGVLGLGYFSLIRIATQADQDDPD